MSAGRVIVPIRGGSDGDPNHRPDPTKYVQVLPPTLYLGKLAVLWMKARGEDLEGVAYTLDRLPAGYAMFGRSRSSERTDYYLFGHPKHKAFDSPNRFFPHFRHIMDNNGNSANCPCTVCNGKQKVVSPSNSSGKPVSKIPPAIPKGRPRTLVPGSETGRVDEEGNPDVYRQFIDKLKAEGTVDEAITEPLSMDWRAEQQCMPQLDKWVKGPQYLPRPGEIVLFVRELPDSKDVTITRDPQTDTFRLYDDTQRRFVGGELKWEAGLIVQMPVEQTIIDDVVFEADKKWNVASSGFRVEPLPSPNSKDKSLSKHYRYVPLHHIRPFVFWKEILDHTDKDKWHPTIINALTAMSTLSLVGKYHFRGKWPEAWVYCHGLYVGSELISVGDTVRLLPKAEGQSSTDVLVISSIRLKLWDLHLASDNDYDKGRPYNTSVYVFGTAYTADQSRSSKEWLTFDAPRTEVLKGYKLEYPLHPPGKELMVPFSRILGRLYNSDSMVLWLQPPPDEDNLLNGGGDGVYEARAFSKANDQRIGPDKNWFWAESRMQALDLHTVNGVDASVYDTERDPKEWRRAIKEIVKATKEQDRVEQRSSLAEHRSLRPLVAPTQENTSLRVDGGAKAGSRPGSSLTGLGGSSTPGNASVKQGAPAPNVIHLSDDEDSEDEDIDEIIREQTRVLNTVVEDNRATKKAKVAVVVKPSSTPRC
ncbi:hypothetical protein M011DRAFT_464327 [Sporormia fimetaria CBS 119925]|uniref:Cryptic loci regulator 2 N-terminal domain-containing protein n=1 Tax=Sporormia fimetaria CBS 119925 TaxID=1340428 RepID=A0A6A6VP40_9PLEO|nr:hypothetical protein M011DRAFT_464327 [Sporormia fimetaria CBS 119925]